MHKLENFLVHSCAAQKILQERFVEQSVEEIVYVVVVISYFRCDVQLLSELATYFFVIYQIRDAGKIEIPDLQMNTQLRDSKYDVVDSVSVIRNLSALPSRTIKQNIIGFQIVVTKERPLFLNHNERM